eukprot:gene6082-6322_t
MYAMGPAPYHMPTVGCRHVGGDNCGVFGWAFVVSAGSEREKLMGMSAISFVVVFFLTSVANVVFSALTLSFFIVAVHGAFRVPDDLFLDESEVGQQILLLLELQWFEACLTITMLWHQGMKKAEVQ